MAERGCFFVVRGECAGHLQRAHLIPKQRIRREFKGQLDPQELLKIVWHPSSWRWMCEHHHHNFDNRQFKLLREDVPPDTEEYAKAFDLVWSLDADYGKRHG